VTTGHDHARRHSVIPFRDRFALVVIDAQEEYFARIGKVVLPDGPAAVGRIERALGWARAAGAPVVHIVHESRRANATTFVPGSPALAIHPQAAPAGSEPVLRKHLPGSFTGTELEGVLRGWGIERVLVAGFMTQMCVDTTARQAAHLGFQVTVLADACAAKSVTGPDGTTIPADVVHRTHLGSLQGFLADITTVERVSA
jgi:nicotinamidase-related amidase